MPGSDCARHGSMSCPLGVSTRKSTTFVLGVNRITSTPASPAVNWNGTRSTRPEISWPSGSSTISALLIPGEDLQEVLLQQEPVVGADRAGDQEVAAVVAGAGLQRRHAAVLRLPEAHRVGELVDVAGHVGDEPGAVFDAVGEYHQRLHVERGRGRVEDAAPLEDAVADRGLAVGVEAVAVDD